MTSSLGAAAARLAHPDDGVGRVVGGAVGVGGATASADGAAGGVPVGAALVVVSLSVLVGGSTTAWRRPRPIARPSRRRPRRSSSSSLGALAARPPLPRRPGHRGDGGGERCLAARRRPRRRARPRPAVGVGVEVQPDRVGRALVELVGAASAARPASGCGSVAAPRPGPGPAAGRARPRRLGVAGRRGGRAPRPRARRRRPRSPASGTLAGSAAASSAGPRRGRGRRPLGRRLGGGGPWPSVAFFAARLPRRRGGGAGRRRPPRGGLRGGRGRGLRRPAGRLGGWPRGGGCGCAAGALRLSGRCAGPAGLTRWSEPVVSLSSMRCAPHGPGFTARGCDAAQGHPLHRRAGRSEDRHVPAKV